MQGSARLLWSGQTSSCLRLLDTAGEYQQGPYHLLARHCWQLLAFANRQRAAITNEFLQPDMPSKLRNTRYCNLHRGLRCGSGMAARQTHLGCNVTTMAALVTTTQAHLLGTRWNKLHKSTEAKTTSGQARCRLVMQVRFATRLLSHTKALMLRSCDLLE